MKQKTLITTTVLGLALLCVFTLFSGISHSGINDTYGAGNVLNRHNLGFQGGYFAYDTLQSCVFCHTPHQNTLAGVPRTDTTGANGGGVTYGTGTPILLWNRTLANATTTYEVYTSPTLDANNTTLRVYSLLCLSCHDGVGSLNSMLNPPGDANIIFGGGPIGQTPLPIGGSGFDQIGDVYCDPSNCVLPGWGANIGDRDPNNGDSGITNISNDHPVSFDYDAALFAADSGLKDPSTLPAALKLYPNAGNQFVSVECSTCHDVHDMGDPAGGTTYPFLRMDNTGSAMCLSCHDK